MWSGSSGRLESGQRAGAERRHVGRVDDAPEPLARRGRAPTRARAGDARAAPAARAAGGCSRARRPRSPASSARATSTRWSPSSAATISRAVRFVQSRRSVATWSLRLRPVWSLAPASPASSVTRRSTAVWMSSSDGSEHEGVRRQLRLHRVERGVDRVTLGRRSAARPSASIATCAREPSTSSAASRRSNDRLSDSAISARVGSVGEPPVPERRPSASSLTHPGSAAA